jgi:DNA-directed RNA polymerase subunit RPC12/RpoP
MPESNPKGIYCLACQGTRLHHVRPSATRGVNGARHRVYACTACESEQPIPGDQMPGIVCPRCGDTRLKTVRTRHRRGATVRVKSCKSCKTRIRTCERVEANAA